MKKTFLILGGIAVAAILSLVAVAYFFADGSEKEKNRAKTEPARQARLKLIREEQQQISEPTKEKENEKDV